MRSSRAWTWRIAATSAMLAGCFLGGGGAALAGSDNSSDTYAGDVNSLALPPGTFIALEYLGYRQGDEYITSNNNIFAKLTGGQHVIPSTLDLYSSITRFAYFTSLLGQPLVLEASAVFARPDTINIGNLPAPVGGLGPQTVGPNFADPVLFASYGLIVNPKQERFLAVTNYLYLPFGDYNKFMQVNVATPGQTTWVPQITYAEGLGKFAPALNKFWIDVIANMSVHSDGGSPLALAPGVQFDRLTQDNSYDLKAFLRYDFMPLGHIAVGIERSWGGDQIASGGLLQPIFGGPTSLGMDDFTKGHLQFAMPLARDFQIATDFTHDFEREGGIREDFTAEIRLTKFFIPQQPQPLK
jgi:hypothetical protein